MFAAERGTAHAPGGRLSDASLLETRGAAVTGCWLVSQAVTPLWGDGRCVAARADALAGRFAGADRGVVPPDAVRVGERAVPDLNAGSRDSSPAPPSSGGRRRRDAGPRRAVVRRPPRHRGRHERPEPPALRRRGRGHPRRRGPRGDRPAVRIGRLPRGRRRPEVTRTTACDSTDPS